MKCSGWSSLGISACSAVALALAAPAGAHVIPKTPFVYASDTSELVLDVPNELGVTMTALRVSAPDGFRIDSAQPTDAWIPRVTPTTVRWSGGRLAPNAQATFTLTVEAPATPGAVTFDATQHYVGGGSVTWPVDLTVLPEEESSQQLGRALVVGLVGLLVIGVLGVLLWRRRGSSLQER